MSMLFHGVLFYMFTILQTRTVWQLTMDALSLIGSVSGILTFIAFT